MPGPSPRGLRYGLPLGWAGPASGPGVLNVGACGVSGLGGGCISLLRVSTGGLAIGGVGTRTLTGSLTSGGRTIWLGPVGCSGPRMPLGWTTGG
jgi:hypothetical protein